MSVAGLLLAAGAGRRYGSPKALVTGDDGVPWVVARARTLLAGGCSPVLVVTGAAADDVGALLAPLPGVRAVHAADWEQGMGGSLRAGLAALGEDGPGPDGPVADDPGPDDPGADDDGGPPVACVVALVDTPGLTPAVVARLVALAAPDALAQAAYDGAPGHPVLLGRGHWAGAAAAATGDRGARDYLRPRAVRRVECGDVGSGQDVDTPDIADVDTAGGGARA